MTPTRELIEIGWPPATDVPACDANERVARIIEQHRNGFTTHDGHEALRAESARGLVPGPDGRPVRPGVGDWVVVESGTPLTLKRLLPRRNIVRRAAAGEHFKEQLLAANLDLVVVVMGLDGDYNPRRLERYLALIAASGVPGLVVLSKADRCENADERLAEIHELAGDVPVLAINGKDPAAVATIAQRLGPGSTAVLLGSSGAGKSTLTNTLMGEVKQKTGDVRANDSRGRHTTTVRSLLKLPGGGCLIDSPGMRELKLTGEENLEEEQFADIEALAAQCRFNDCQHDAEPGCAVIAAIDSGELDADRYAHFCKLAGERDAALALRAGQQRKAEEKSIHRAFNQRLTDKHGRR
jgi:ribosome biogenesis GTPase